MPKPRILLIDDDPGLRKTLADILKAKGYEPLLAENGAQGLAALAQHSTHLVLLDLGLPDIAGIDLLHRIKTDYPSTEAIILTGNATLDSAMEATNRGAFSYLLKPYDIELLLLQVKRAIEKQQAQEEIAARSAELEKFNAELKALFDISSAINRNIDMDSLLAEILDTLAGTLIFPFEIKGALFVLKDGELWRSSFIKLSEGEVEPCQRIRRGECLCGQAVTTGEVVVSKNSEADPRHCLCSPKATPHGRIIVPLKKGDMVVGVLSIYTRADQEVDKRTIDLLSTIGNQVGIAIENARLYEETKAFSLHDSLTGLANRRFMEIQLGKAFDAAKRYAEELSVIMLDIDHFKAYNDTYGHAEGDKLLSRLGTILREGMRSSDCVFRYGGEEFLIALPRTDAVLAGELAERLRKAVEAETGNTVSLGVASFEDGMQDREELVRKADAALYAAKCNGRNRVETAKGSGAKDVFSA